MAIKFRCPNCNEKIKVDDDWAGIEMLCAKCRQMIRVPSPGEKSSELPEPAPAVATSPKGMRHCRVCNELIAKEAEVCPHCGKRYKKPPAPAKTLGCGGCLLLLIIGGCTLYLIGHCAKEEEPEGPPKTVKQKVAPISKQPKREPTAEVRERVVIPQYTVLDERIDDARLLYAKVILSVLVSGEITEDGLKALLNELYSSVKSRKDFKFEYHDSPTAIFIYAYTKEYADSYPMGQWIAMLIKTDQDESKKPEISINDSQIAQLGAKAVVKFGLTEEKRKEIWQETIKAEDRAREDAQKKYPWPYYQHLQVGETYELPKGAPLMPEMEPIDPLGAIARMRKIQPRESIEIFEVKLDKYRSVWYFVKATDAYGREIGWGYVNSLALASQFNQEEKERMQKNAEFQSSLMEKYKAQLAQKYNLTDDQFRQIEIEGMVKDWPFPKQFPKR